MIRNWLRGRKARQFASDRVVFITDPAIRTFVQNAVESYINLIESRIETAQLIDDTDAREVDLNRELVYAHATVNEIKRAS